MDNPKIVIFLSPSFLIVGGNTENLTIAREIPEIVNKRLTPNVLYPKIRVIKTARVDTYVIKDKVCKAN